MGAFFLLYVYDCRDVIQWCENETYMVVRAKLEIDTKRNERKEISA